MPRDNWVSAGESAFTSITHCKTHLTMAHHISLMGNSLFRLGSIAMHQLTRGVTSDPAAQHVRPRHSNTQGFRRVTGRGQQCEQGQRAKDTHRWMASPPGRTQKTRRSLKVGKMCSGGNFWSVFGWNSGIEWLYIVSYLMQNYLKASQRLLNMTTMNFVTSGSYVFDDLWPVRSHKTCVMVFCVIFKKINVLGTSSYSLHRTHKWNSLKANPLL